MVVGDAMMRRPAIKGAPESNVCDICNEECLGGVGQTHYFQDRGQWWQQRQCRACAVSLGDLQDERAQSAIEVAERAGV